MTLTKVINRQCAEKLLFCPFYITWHISIFLQVKNKNIVLWGNSSRYLNYNELLSSFINKRGVYSANVGLFPNVYNVLEWQKIELCTHLGFCVATTFSSKCFIPSHWFSMPQSTIHHGKYKLRVQNCLIANPELQRKIEMVRGNVFHAIFVICNNFRISNTTKKDVLNLNIRDKLNQWGCNSLQLAENLIQDFNNDSVKLLPTQSKDLKISSPHKYSFQ